MEGPNTKNVQATVKQVNTFDDKRAEGFLEWQAKVCTTLSLYNRLFFIANEHNGLGMKILTAQQSTQPGTWQTRTFLRVNLCLCRLNIF